MISAVISTGYISFPSEVLSRLASSRTWSLKVGHRSSQPSGVYMLRIVFSSACWGMADWRKMTDFSGSMPTLMKSTTISVMYRGSSSIFRRSVNACQTAAKK
ncbi:MAG: hypothetical protein BWY66_01672 [bacterium ADurb.Bin374]|nr:MAG: hypothetical protein BWY66_01672 [bacterium ADurb.Bin374]